MPPDWRLQVVDSNWPDRLERSTQPTPDSRSQDSNPRQKGTNHGRYGRSELPPRRITHANHPRSLCLVRIFQCLAVPRQPLKLLETLEIRVLVFGADAGLGRESSYRTPVKLVQFLAGNSQFVATVLKTVLGTLPDGFGELVAILVLKHISWGPDHGFSFDDHLLTGPTIGHEYFRLLLRSIPRPLHIETIREGSPKSSVGSSVWRPTPHYARLIWRPETPDNRRQAWFAAKSRSPFSWLRASYTPSPEPACRAAGEVADFLSLRLR